ncbi:MAG: CopG family transcriptional regulator [Crenarchaeota archaeon]|nr:CopG family transcriptional regulator [Thermoproteota archaeon]
MPKICLELAEDELAKLFKASEEAGFSKPEDFLKFLIEEAVGVVQVSEEDMKEVAERLKSLGYF